MSEQQTETPDIREIAERIVRMHEDFCVGHFEPASAWCSSFLNGDPLCAACQKLADAIAVVLLSQRASLSQRLTAVEEENRQLKDEVERRSVAPFTLVLVRAIGSPRSPNDEAPGAPCHVLTTTGVVLTPERYNELLGAEDEFAHSSVAAIVVWTRRWEEQRPARTRLSSS